MRTSTIFKSRWMALIWAAGILWFAVDFAGDPQDGGNDVAATDASGAPVDAEAERRLANALDTL